MSFFKRYPKEIQIILFFAVLKLVIHLFSNSHFGFHRDELLYMAMSDHLDWGYKEVPPFIAGISWFSYAFLGDSVFAMRILPSIASALIVFWLSFDHGNIFGEITCFLSIYFVF